MRPVDFKDKDVFVVGSGPSLTGFDFSKLEGREVIAVNHAYKLTPHQVHTFYDQTFLTEAAKDGYDYTKHPAHIVASKSSGCVESENVTIYRRSNMVSRKIEQGLYCGYSSAQAAVNYALIMGARAVFLLGIDCKYLSPDEVRRCAAFNGNPAAADEVLKGMDFAHHVSQQNTAHSINVKEKEKKYTNMAPQFSLFAGHPVYNCSPCSALTLKFFDIREKLGVLSRAS